MFGTSFIFFVNTTHTLSTTKSHNKPWIIDSGATDHITCSLHYFHTHSKIRPMDINLPNGHVVKAHISGTIYFSPNFAIHGVLYVLEFTFNLLSISKLISNLKYSIIFSHHSCQIQEMNMLKMIVSTKLKEGLYHLEIKEKESSSQLPFIINASINHTNDSTL